MPRNATDEAISRRTIEDSWRDAWRRHRKLCDRCRRRLTRKGIHQLRVATRRLLVHLELFAALGVELRPRARRQLKRLMRATGRVRDAQVQLRLVDRVLAQRRHADSVRFRRYLRQRERKLRARLAERVAKRNFFPKVSPRRGRTPARPGPAVAAALRQAGRRLERRRKRAAPDDPRAQHRLRVALKRYRYLREILPAPEGSPAAAELKELKRAQSALGDLHDRDVLARRLEKFARRHGASGAWLRAQRRQRHRHRREIVAAAPRSARQPRRK